MCFIGYKMNYYDFDRVLTVDFYTLFALRIFRAGILITIPICWSLKADRILKKKHFLYLQYNKLLCMTRYVYRSGALCRAKTR